MELYMELCWVIHKKLNYVCVKQIQEKIENLENIRTKDYLVFISLSKNVKEYIFRNMECLIIKQERISKKI